MSHARGRRAGHALKLLLRVVLSVGLFVVLLSIALEQVARLRESGLEGVEGPGAGGGGAGRVTGFVLDGAYVVLRLCVEAPVLGLPLVALGVVMLLVFLTRKPVETRAGLLHGMGLHDSGPERRSERKRTVAQLARLREVDPSFSLVPFLDFVVLLYARGQAARGTEEVQALAPYFAATELAALERRRPGSASADDVCAGGARVVQVGVGTARTELVVEVEASLPQQGEGDQSVAIVSRERWTFHRSPGVLSKRPSEIATLGCPSCGKPVALSRDGRCASCGQVAGGGRFHWTVVHAKVLERRPPRPDEVLVRGADEIGPNRPTRVDQRLEAEARALRARYPGFTFKSFEAEAAAIFLRMQEAWTASDERIAHPFATSAVFQAQRFWIERYRRAGRVQKLDDAAVEKVVLAKVERDAFFESVTVRIFASAKEWLAGPGGTLVRGDREKARRFSEYWTFVRRAGFDPKKGPDARLDGNCPKCGASPMKIGLQGECLYCNARVSSGSLGWTVARIEPDELYEG